MHSGRACHDAAEGCGAGGFRWVIRDRSLGTENRFMSAMPRKRRRAVKASPVAKGQRTNPLPRERAAREVESWARAEEQLRRCGMTSREAGLRIEGLKHSNLKTGASHDLHQVRRSH